MTRNVVESTAKLDERPWQMYELDRDSWVPLYYQIKTRLLGAMAQGQLLPGDILPSEDWLARTAGVSRMTARQALNDLRIEGYVVRSRGSGTFVADGAQRKAEKELRAEIKDGVQGVLSKRS